MNAFVHHLVVIGGCMAGLSAGDEACAPYHPVIGISRWDEIRHGDRIA